MTGLEPLRIQSLDVVLERCVFSNDDGYFGLILPVSLTNTDSVYWLAQKRKSMQQQLRARRRAKFWRAESWRPS